MILDLCIEFEYKNSIGRLAKDYPFWTFIENLTWFSFKNNKTNEEDDLFFHYIYTPDKSWLGPYYPDDADYAVVSNYFEGNTELNDFLNKDYYKKFWYFNVMKDCFVSVDGSYKDQAKIYGERDENGNTKAMSKVEKADMKAYSLTH